MVCDMIKTTLGPCGSDKMMVSSGPMKEIRITNDGATIMKYINFQNPGAQLFSEMSICQDTNAGDGTSSVVVFASALYKACLELILKKHLHPQIVCSGLESALDIIMRGLEEFTIDFKKMTEEESHQTLVKMASTSLSSKIVNTRREFFANIAVEAIKKIGTNSLQCINILKKDGASMDESKIIDGFLLDKQIGIGQRKRIENPKILVANTQMDTDKIKVFGASVKVDRISKLTEIEEAEKEKMMDKVNAIVDSKCDVFINRQLIYDYPEQELNSRGVETIEHADFEGVERLATVLNAEIASTFGEKQGTQSIQLGTCGLMEERSDILAGTTEPMILFSDLPAKGACTVILRGSTNEVLDEVERSLHDALRVIQKSIIDQRYVLGGGCFEVLMSKYVSGYAQKETNAVKRIIFEQVAEALLEIPTVLSDNSGMDAATVVATLKTAVEQGSKSTGIDAISRTVCDVSGKGIFDSCVVKENVIKGAFEAVKVLLRVDGLVVNPPYKRLHDTRNH